MPTEKQNGFSQVLLVIIVCLVISAVSFLYGKAVGQELESKAPLANADFENAKVLKEIFLGYELAYPENKFTLQAISEPDPEDPSQLGSFWLTDNSDPAVFIHGEFINATTRFGVDYIGNFVEKEKLEQTYIGRVTNKLGSGYDVHAYTKIDKDHTVYYYPFGNYRVGSLLLLKIEVPNKIVGSEDVKKILLSVGSL